MTDRAAAPPREAARMAWREVRDRIHARILDRTYRPGDKLPRDADLADAFGCARSTVQRAMQDLADTGLVERRRRGGTHVRPDPVARATLDIPITRREVEQRGAVYGYRLLGAGLETPPPVIAATLGPGTPDRLLRVRALHLADQRPYILEDRWINPETVPEIAGVDLAAHSANEWLVRNKPYTRYDLRVFAEAADTATADLFGVREGAALLVLDRTTWVDAGPITTVRATTAPGHQVIARSQGASGPGGLRA